MPRSRPTILIADDDPGVRHVLQVGLSHAGYAVREAADGNEMLATAGANRIELILLDIDMPGRDGLSALQELRDQHVGTPVIMLTQQGGVDERIRGLETGADDYVAKPFDLRELLARVAAVLKRAGVAPNQPPLLRIGTAVIDLPGRTASKQGKPLKLTRTDFALLELLHEHRGRPVARETIEQRIWAGVGTRSHALDTHLWRLRRKLGDPDGRFIQNAVGLGYLLVE